MSHQEYIAKCDEDQLSRLIELAQEKLTVIRSKPKKEYFVVGDEWRNIAFFELTDHEAALKCFSKEFGKQVGVGVFDGLRIDVVKYLPEDIEDMLMEGNK